MPLFSPAKSLPVAAVVMAFALGGCVSGTTYGTGVSPGKQTVDDIVGLVSLGGSKEKSKIDYEPRPPIVAPPASASLPTPGEASSSATAANWPKDPGTTTPGDVAAIPVSTARPTKLEGGSAAEAAALAHMKYGKQQAKLYADAKASADLQLDANGNPIRRTLSDPPPAYRVPDPNAPEEFEAPKKKKWWQFGR